MKLFRIAAYAALLSLAGCGTAPIGTPATPAVPAAPETPDQLAAKVFATVCQGAPLADLAFQTARAFASTVIDASAVTWEAAVYAGIEKRCTGTAPTVGTYQEAVTELETDLASIASVVSSAKANAPAAATSPH